MVLNPWWTRAARKVTEEQLKTALEDAGTVADLGLTAPIYIRWPGIPLPKQAPNEYVRYSFHPAPVTVRTMGPNGRIEGRGFIKLGVFTRLGEPQDRNDTIAGVVARAFPYNLNLVREGIRVTITTADHLQFVEMDGWGYSPVDVNWDVWRTT